MVLGTHITIRTETNTVDLDASQIVSEVTPPIETNGPAH
jgi:hypothetical protein